MFSAEDKETKEIWKGEPNVIELCGRFHTGAENVFDLLNEAFNEVHSDVYKECISLDGQFRDVNLNVLLSLDFHFGIKIQMNITLNPVKVDEVGRLTSLLLDSNEKILKLENRMNEMDDKFKKMEVVKKQVLHDIVLHGVYNVVNSNLEYMTIQIESYGDWKTIQNRETGLYLRCGDANILHGFDRAGHSLDERFKIYTDGSQIYISDCEKYHHQTSEKYHNLRFLNTRGNDWAFRFIY